MKTHRVMHSSKRDYWSDKENIAINHMQFDLAPKYNEKARDKLAQVKAAKGMPIGTENGEIKAAEGVRVDTETNEN